MVNKRQAGNITAGTSRDVKNAGKFASLYLPLVWQQMMMTYLWTYVMKTRLLSQAMQWLGHWIFLAPVLVLVGLYIISSLKVQISSVSPWNIVLQNTLSAFIEKGALPFEYNIIMIVTQAYTILGLLHQKLIFFFLVFAHLQSSAGKNIRVHILGVKWYFSVLQVPLPFGTRKVLFPFHILWQAGLKTGQCGTPWE